MNFPNLGASALLKDKTRYFSIRGDTWQSLETVGFCSGVDAASI